jgi:predicted nucleic acid-binding protein
LILLDACAVIAFFAGEPAMEEVTELLDSEVTIFMTAIGRAEVVDFLIRNLKVDKDTARADLSQLPISETLAIDANLAEIAGAIRGMKYQRTSRCLSMADCCAIAVAQHYRLTLASSDADLLLTADEMGVATKSLPNS